MIPMTRSKLHKDADRLWRRCRKDADLRWLLEGSIVITDARARPHASSLARRIFRSDAGAGCQHLPNYRTRRGFHLRRLQVTLSAAKIGARGAVHEKASPGGVCLCINRREDQGTWGLAREDARESARN